MLHQFLRSVARSTSISHAGLYADLPIRCISEKSSLLAAALSRLLGCCEAAGLLPGCSILLSAAGGARALKVQLVPHEKETLENPFRDTAAPSDAARVPSKRMMHLCCCRAVHAHLYASAAARVPPERLLYGDAHPKNCWTPLLFIDRRLSP